jgi:transitional endoplasmic reticulum ATPase
MQGFEENSNIIFMAATNRPWDVDPAFLRPGRFNSIIMVDLPDRNARREIVESELDPSMLASDFNIDKVIELTEGFSAADMVEFCERLKDLAIWRIIKTKTDSLIGEADILTIKGNLSTSVNAHELKRIRDYKATH